MAARDDFSLFHVIKYMYITNTNTNTNMSSNNYIIFKYIFCFHPMFQRNSMHVLYLTKHLPNVAVQFDRRIYLKSHQIYSYSPKYLSKCCGAIRYRIYEDIPASRRGSLHHCPNCIPINIIIVININIIN